MHFTAKITKDTRNKAGYNSSNLGFLPVKNVFEMVTTAAATRRVKLRLQQPGT
jgi:hypothetical protein